MTMPTAAVSTTNLDATGDTPSLARADLLDAVQKLNQIIAHISTAAATVLDDISVSAMLATMGGAPLASPALTGVPTAPTATPGTNTAQLATCAFALANGMPVATLIHVAQSTAPSGFLKANGAAVSRTTYAALFAVVGVTFGAGDGSTTFNLPDVRGEFIRGWDDSRGIDSGRTLGSAQADDLKAHLHAMNADGRNVPKRFGSDAFDAKSVSSQVDDFNYGGDQNTGNTGGTETRPRNIAWLGCIKY